jgi:hypothetical protein
MITSGDPAASGLRRGSRCAAADPPSDMASSLQLDLLNRDSCRTGSATTRTCLRRLSATPPRRARSTRTREPSARSCPSAVRLRLDFAIDLTVLMRWAVSRVRQFDDRRDAFRACKLWLPRLTDPMLEWAGAAHLWLRVVSAVSRRLASAMTSSAPNAPPAVHAWCVLPTANMNRWPVRVGHGCSATDPATPVRLNLRPTARRTTFEIGQG